MFGSDVQKINTFIFPLGFKIVNSKLKIMIESEILYIYRYNILDS